MFKIADADSRNGPNYPLSEILDRADEGYEHIGSIYQSVERPQFFYLICCDGFLEIELGHNVPIRVMTAQAISCGDESDVIVTPCRATLTFDPTGAL